MFDSATWAAVPFHFWSVVLFILGSVVGSFLNVCIHRLPREESLISPPSHCPHCQYSIPWYLNVPLITWLYLRGRCAHCGAAIAVRYFLVELLTGVLFMACWLSFGAQQPLLVLGYTVLLSGFVVATFIDFEHFIIPNQITLGGVVVGFLLSALAPGMHGMNTAQKGLEQSVIGILTGAGILYTVLRGGKWLFGKRKVSLPPATRIVFGETALKLPDQDIPYEELYYRQTDCIEVQAASVLLQEKVAAAALSSQPEVPANQAPETKIQESSDPLLLDAPVVIPEVSIPGRHTFTQVQVRLYQDRLVIGETVFNPENIQQLEVVSDRIVLPQEAMGLGDVKFMAAIGAFLGWQGVVFSLLASSIIGSAVSLVLIALRKRAWSSLIPYGPYIALAATLWIFFGKQIVRLLAL